MSNQILTPFTQEIVLSDEAATVSFARALAKLAELGDVIALWGTLGVGKSVFARAFIRQLTSPLEEVPSPTFTLVQNYEGMEAEIYHFDFYRLEEVDEAYELGIEEAFSDGISLLEWPERIEPLLPRDRLDITLIHGETDEARQLTLKAEGKWAERLTKGCDGSCGGHG
ncbi:MAG: tRNA (adenosine(37)-N6)-threonylcarbamoyltransferase complex ATPase subunit type 1 TsaE [Alphaproteobacteria bacterium]|nr:tRNA (adenosine(37)-N6)-threonylcarbamoyltransferase complex ATPase subunit type 1 TsaE [Rhodospirillales bacterium]MCW9045877.1 tRNA (adenosine(37)-N6)-threonylcarbamoyltransferase complex ATPase subunit type 1 TsaE [Alphaproteobacteria bacterium]